MKEQLFWIFSILIVISLTDCRKKAGETEESQKGEEVWIQLFNGVDLSNWKAKIKGYPLGENFANTFRVEDGKIFVDYRGYDKFENRFGHLFYDIPYSSYRLRMKYRFVGSQAKGGESWAIKNSGVMIHSQAPESMRVDQDFPVSVEVQLLGGLTKGELRPTANLCSPGTHVVMNDTLVTEHCVNSDSDTFYGDEWIDLELLVYGDSLIVHYVNQKEVLRYSKPMIGGEYNELKEKEGSSLSYGHIALQSESHPIEFKSIELMNLKEQ
jgi:hypothetical protein